MAAFASTTTSLQYWSNVLSSSSSSSPDSAKLSSNKNEDNGSFTSSVNAHFLPKFANQSSASSTRLCPPFASSAKSSSKSSLSKSSSSKSSSSSGRLLFSVSKKHSGSLVMCPPFYSKNGTGNKYSRCGAWVLWQHFCCVWTLPGEAESQFNSWWARAEKSRLCYCFECVVPSALGDHGATPYCAYLVLTCISSTSTGDFLGPEELLEEAIKWRLPLNEVWYLDVDKGVEVESKLHELRWEMCDKDVNDLLDTYAMPQRFLRHGEAQGEVLEGVVLMVVDVPDLQRLRDLIRLYNVQMETSVSTALEAGRTIAERCKPGGDMYIALNQSEGADLVKAMPECYHEPTHLSNVTDEQVWSFVRSHGPHATLFQRLYEPYRSVVSLKVYIYKEALQVQLNVRKDEVFYAWPLHVLQSESKVSKLFRGMVISYTPSPFSSSSTASGIVGGEEEKPETSRIVAIAKLKFLNYLWRTFGIRNNLDALLDGNSELKPGGKDGYMRRLRRGFLKDWEVPLERHEGVMNRFARWADIVVCMNKEDRLKLKKSYLPYVERLLNPDPTLPYLSVLLFNFTQRPLPTERLERLGISTNRRTLNPTTCQVEGSITIVDRVINRKELDTYATVLVLTNPNPNAPDTPAYRQLRQRYAPLIAQGHIVVNPVAPQDWLQPLVSRLRGARGRPQDKAAPSPSPSTQRTCFVVAILALPPGGGKSTFFKALTRAGHAQGVPVSIVSSDAFGRGKPARQRFEAAVMKAAVKGDGQPVGIVGYDKNLPNMDAWDRVFGGIIRKISYQADVHVIPVVPATLNRDAMWHRVLRRPASADALAVSESLSEAKVRSIYHNFFRMASSFLPAAQRSKGVYITGSFMPPSTPADLEILVAKIVRAVKDHMAGNTVKDKDKDESKVTPHVRHQLSIARWAAAEIVGHEDFHVTLVPPRVDGLDGDEAGRKEALKRMACYAGKEVEVKLSAYHIVKPMKSEGRSDQGTRGNVCFGLWEVEEIQGLPYHYEPQRLLYHLTDLGSLSNAVKPRHALDAMSQIQRHRKGEWTNPTYEVKTDYRPFVLQAKVAMLSHK